MRAPDCWRNCRYLDSGQSALEYVIAAAVLMVVIGWLYAHWAAVGPESGAGGLGMTLVNEAPYTVPAMANSRQQWLADIAAH